ncbi:hypothetical protein MBLNU13_g09852t3 [Cladosporium sp. NU13]
MAMLQFISAGLPTTALPTSIHSDHLIVAENGAIADLANAKQEYSEVYHFLGSASKKYGIGFWKPGSGIIHTIILENYAFPGGLIIGTDSHTPNAGGMGMMGIGGRWREADRATWWMDKYERWVLRLCFFWDAIADQNVADIILHIAGLLTVSGGKGKVLEFFGPGAATLGATAMATVCNMSAEIGSTSCIFPYSDAMGRYLTTTDRTYLAAAAEENLNLLQADRGSEKHYDDVIEIDLSTLEPHINGPFTPDLSHTLSSFARDVEQSSWPKDISHAMIGSCTNASFEDLSKAARLFREASDAGLKPKMPVFVTAGSEKIRATVEREGIMQDFEAAGATILSNSCGPCVGQWNRKELEKGTPNSVVSSYNRNFVGRHDGNPETHSFVTSPELVATFAFAGSLQFNPATDTILLEDGQQFRFSPPHVEELPTHFEDGTVLYQAPPKDSRNIDVQVSPTSDSLQLLKPFEPWREGQANELSILIKVKGKCTTDHISPAGPWYKYRGHLENISNNLLTGAESDVGSKTLRGETLNLVTSTVATVPEVAKFYRNANIRWCIVGDWNYGEGSSREHAALEPRYLGGVAVIARSFARIHETNLKKQGMLALTFADPAKYDEIKTDDKLSIVGADELKPGKNLTLHVDRADGKSWETEVHYGKKLRTLSPATERDGGDPTTPVRSATKRKAAVSKTADMSDPPTPGAEHGRGKEKAAAAAAAAFAAVASAKANATSSQMSTVRLPATEALLSDIKNQPLSRRGRASETFAISHH